MFRISLWIASLSIIAIRLLLLCWKQMTFPPHYPLAAALCPLLSGLCPLLACRLLVWLPQMLCQIAATVWQSQLKPLPEPHFAIAFNLLLAVPTPQFSPPPSSFSTTLPLALLLLVLPKIALATLLLLLLNV